MDSIKKLLQNRQFELVLKLTEGTEDVDNLFYRLSAFLGIGNDKEALELIEKYKFIMDENRLELMKVHFDILYSHKMYKKAKNALNYYDSLPYFSYEAEEFIKEQIAYLEDILDQKDNQFHNLSVDEIKELLLKPTSKEEMVYVLNAIRTMNINLFIEELRTFLLSSYNEVIKTFALLALVEQKVMVDIDFLKNGIVYSLNPYELNPPYCDELYDEIVKLMYGRIKDPSISHVAEELFNMYILEVYPEEVEEDEIDLIVSAFLIVATQYMGGEADIEQFATQYLLNEEILEAKVDEINDILKRSQRIDN